MATTCRWRCCADAGKFRCRSCSRADARRPSRGGEMRGTRWFIFLGLLLALYTASGSRAEDQPKQTPAPAASPSAPAKEPTPTPAPPPPPSVTIIGPREAHGVLGRDVRSPTDEDMGHI